MFSMQPYLRKLYAALYLTAYYGLFRVGELATGDHPILAQNVHIATNKNKLLFYLETSKTHGKDKEPQMVKITAVQQKNTIDSKQKDNDYCPFLALRSFLKVRPGFYSEQEAFFVFRDQWPIKPEQFRITLKKALQRAGLQDNLYNGHSFRAGRSIDLLNMGISVETIKKLGRWSIKSNAVFKYLRYT